MLGVVFGPGSEVGAHGDMLLGWPDARPVDNHTAGQLLLFKGGEAFLECVARFIEAPMQAVEGFAGEGFHGSAPLHHDSFAQVHLVLARCFDNVTRNRIDAGEMLEVLPGRPNAALVGLAPGLGGKLFQQLAEHESVALRAL